MRDGGDLYVHWVSEELNEYEGCQGRSIHIRAIYTERVVAFITNRENTRNVSINHLPGHEVYENFTDAHCVPRSVVCLYLARKHALDTLQVNYNMFKWKSLPIVLTACFQSFSKLC